MIEPLAYVEELPRGWSAVLGRVHPLLLHLPIGVMIGLAAIELYSMAKRADVPRRFTALLAALGALSAIASAGSGWLLAREGDYAELVLQYHRWLGVGVAACSTACALAHARAVRGG